MIIDELDQDAAFAATLPPRPYPGLRPFDESEWPIFFGRERMVDAVVTRLIRDQLVIVHGDSGSGKSSLIRAGVLPRLRQEQARGGLRWRTCTVLPRGGPLRNLARALATLDGGDADVERVLAVRRALNLGRRAPAALAELLLADDNDHVCILIDQFEELFEYARAHGEAEARGLTEILVSMAQAPQRGLYVALTMRSEYLGACARFPGLAEAVNVRQYLLPPMDNADLLRAIREPASLYGGQVEPQLAERLVADASGPDGLPLVQHALMLMYRTCGGREPWQLRQSDYPPKGLAAQLSDHADEVAQRATPASHPGLVKDMMRALTAINAEGHAVRRPQTLETLAGITGAPLPLLAQVVDVFRAEDVSFLTPRDPRPLQGDDLIDFGHEAPIRCWRALAEPPDGWLQGEFRNGLVWRSLLVQADSFERDPENVLSSATTEERASWIRRRTPAWAERYGGGWDRVQRLLTASEAHRQQELKTQKESIKAQLAVTRAHRGIAIVLIVATVMMGLLGVAVWGWRVSILAEAEAQSSTARAEEEAKQAVALAKSVSAYLAQLVQAKPAAARDEALAKLEAQVRAVSSDQGTTGGAAIPRIYVHTGTSTQKQAATEFVARLSEKRSGEQVVLALGPQLVEGQRNNGVLRCFRANECRDEAPRILAMANAQLDSPKLELQDLSARYGQSTTIRPHHYEVWFGNAELKLSPAPASNSNKN